MPDIIKELETVASEICDKYCKWPQEYEGISEYEDECAQRLADERCCNCPLNQFF